MANKGQYHRAFRPVSALFFGLGGSKTTLAFPDGLNGRKVR